MKIRLFIMEIPDFLSEFSIYTYQYDWMKIGIFGKKRSGYKLKRMKKYEN